MKENVTRCLVSSCDVTQTPVPIAAAAMCALFIFSMAANCLVVVIFVARPALLTLSNRLILNLTICNLLICIVVMPTVVVSMTTGTWVLSDVVCNVSGFLMTLLFGASNLTVTVISIDRYFAILSPLHYKQRMTPSRNTTLVMGVWLLSVCVSVPPLLGWSSFSFHRDLMTCTVNWSSDAAIDVYYVFLLTAIFFVLPLVGMVGIYAAIFSAARGNSLRARRNSVLPAQTDDETSVQRVERRGSGSVSTLRRLSSGTIRLGQQLTKKEGWKAGVTSVIVIMSFIGCWMPYFCVAVIQAVQPNRIVDTRTGSIAIILACLNCACTPIIYVFRSRTARLLLIHIVRRQTLVQEFPERNGSRRPSDVSDTVSSSVTQGRGLTGATTQVSTITLPGTSSSC